MPVLPTCQTLQAACLSYDFPSSYCPKHLFAATEASIMQPQHLITPKQLHQHTLPDWVSRSKAVLKMCNIEELNRSPRLCLEPSYTTILRMPPFPHLQKGLTSHLKRLRSPQELHSKMRHAIYYGFSRYVFYSEPVHVFCKWKVNTVRFTLFNIQFTFPKKEKTTLQSLKMPKTNKYGSICFFLRLICSSLPRLAQSQ